MRNSYLRKTLDQRIATHEALVYAELQEEADVFALATIVRYFMRIGRYQLLLDQWLPVIRESAKQEIQARALNESGVAHNNLGNYDKALDYYQQSLVIAREIGDRRGEGRTLNNMSAIAHTKGDYETALDYLKQSLAIQREIGDVAGLCATLFNIGHIHWTKGEQQEAVAAWIQAYVIAKQIGEAQALNALDNLAKQLGGAGLKFWEQLARQSEA